MSSTRPDLRFTDTVDERSFFRKYAGLSTKDATTIRFIDHNNKDYFTALDEDADLVAENIYKTQSVLKYNNSNKNRYVTISPQVFLNNVLKFCIIDRHMKVEIYHNKTFQLLSTATPGNLEALATEYGINLEGMFKDCSTPMVASIKFQQTGNARKVGVCVIDTSNSTIQVSEFEDNDLFSNLESLLLQLGVKEVVLPSNYSAKDENTEALKLFQVLDKIGYLVVSSIRSSFFTAKDIEQDLRKLVSSESQKEGDDINVDLVLAAKGINTVDFTLSLACCNALIAYLQLLSDDVQNSFTIDQYNLSSYMKLDSSTMKALNIFPSTNSTFSSAIVKSSNISSIFELLNKCRTAAGSRLLSQWLKQPLTSLSMIEERLDLVNYLVDDTNFRVYANQEFLSQVPDMRRLLKKIGSGLSKSTGNENKKLEDIVILYQLVLILPEFVVMTKMVVADIEEKDSLRVANLIKKHWLEPVEKSLISLSKFQEMIETTIDLSPLESTSAYDQLHSDFNVRPEFDDSLIEINDTLQASLTEIKQLHIEVADDLNMELDKKLKLEKHIQHGWCFRVTRNDSSVLRNTGNKYSQLQTVKAGVFFTTKRLTSLSQEYAQALQEYNSKQRELIKEILSISLSYQSVFMNLSLTLAHLDVLVSFANVAIVAPTVFARPKLHPLSSDIDSDQFKDRKINLREARHPLLEVQDDINFIANDVFLSNNMCDKGKPFVIITGPNMGGKSTYIRQIGVIALMAQVGSFIPASEDDSPELPIFDAILSRVGAGDSQLKGLSTFMIEMLETSSILAAATQNSLIIIDELGRGTSSYDGFGLAWAISEHLIKEKSCFTLFATHFHELTQLSSKYEDKVDNLHVVAHMENKDENDDDITLMYRVEPGVSDKSFGIHVAELVKFPSKIIHMAKRKASELQDMNVTEEDKFIQNKKTKCSTEEIDQGIDNLKIILKKWKDECYDAETSKCRFESGEAVSKLKELVEGEFSGLVANDKFITEILTAL